MIITVTLTGWCWFTVPSLPPFTITTQNKNRTPKTTTKARCYSGLSPGDGVPLKEGRPCLLFLQQFLFWQPTEVFSDGEILTDTKPHLSGVAGWHSATAPRVGRLVPRWRRLLQATRQRLAAVEWRSVWIHFRAQTSDSPPRCDWLLVNRDL